MSNKKRSREEEDHSSSGRDVTAKLNSSLSASRTGGGGGGRGGGSRSRKSAKRHHGHSPTHEHNHHNDNNSNNRGKSREKGQEKEVLPYHVKKSVSQVIRKPTVGANTETVLATNEFGRQVTRAFHSSSSSSSSSLRLYAKNFVPTIDANPHIEQIRGGIVTVKREDELERVLQPEAPRMPYRRRRGEVKSVVHWGQRKLLVSEIEFLTMHAHDNITVVYAGSAPGTHIPFLSRLFPTVNFVLVDPSDFACPPSERITLRKEFMTNEIAAEFANRDTLLISDIRSGDFQVMDAEEMERCVQRDMDWQMQWHKIMRPKAGMYKFRLPWTAGETEYLAGEIYLPVWGPQTTTETRLIVTGDRESEPELRRYDHKTYEEQMFYFNNVTRCCLYKHDIAASGLDHCFDCSSEVAVLKRYLRKYFALHFPRSTQVRVWEDLSESDISRKISALVDTITFECGGGKPEHGRNLLQWQKRFNARAAVSVAREFDTHNLKVVKLSPAEFRANADIVRLQNANATRILQHSWETAQHLQQQRKEQETATDGETVAHVLTGWCALPEVVMEDVGWNAGKSGRFGGTYIPAKTAADAWLWGSLAELAGVQEKWTEPPFCPSAVTAVTASTSAAAPSTAEDDSMQTNDVPAIETPADSVSTDKEPSTSANEPTVTFSVTGTETAPAPEHAMDEDVDGDNEDHGGESQRARGLVLRSSQGEDPTAAFSALAEKEKEPSAEDVEALSREAELHNSLFLSEGSKFELVDRIWTDAVAALEHAQGEDKELEKKLQEWLHNDKLHKVLVFICGSGSTYFFCPDLISGTVAKFQLPTVHPELLHATLLAGMLDFTRIEQPKKLHLLGFHSVCGERAAGVWSAEEQKEQLRAFVNEEFNFDSPARALVLSMNGFKVIDTI